MQTSKATAIKSHFSKRNLLRGLMLSVALGASVVVVAQQAVAVPPAVKASGQVLPVVEVYKSPQCGCCKSWASHLEAAGFKVVLHDVDDVSAARHKLGMPDKFGSCHTARVGQYLIEGHVPAADIKRLLNEHPDAKGLAVPGMVQGSPGMEGDTTEIFDTLLVSDDGTAKVFNHH
jgi:hypothetical protein